MMDAKLSADIDRLHAMITPEMRRAADPFLYGVCDRVETFRKATVASFLELEDVKTLLKQLAQMDDKIDTP